MQSLINDLLDYSQVSTSAVYSAETDHVIPWQIDQGFSWRTEVVNAVEVLSKAVV